MLNGALWAWVVAAGVVGAEPGVGRVETVATPPRDGSNSHYVSNRAPLAPSPLMKLPVGSIEPRGWVRGQLEMMREGMTGRLAEVSGWCEPEGNAWLSPTGEGEHGWEELPYWLKGYGDLGYVLKDEEIAAEARVWIEGILGSQREDGYFGPESNRKNKDVWPNMPALNALQTYHEATGDERVIPFMLRYFRWQAGLPAEEFLPESWQKVRAGDNIETVLWVYNRTGEAWLLELAHRLHEGTIRWDERVANWHGVNISQGFREPAVYWMMSKDPAHLAATERNYREVMEGYGQVPGGMFGADENVRKGRGDPRQAAETCSMVEFMHSFQMLCGITGEGVWADRCEEVAFNSLPAAFMPDYSGLRYLTSPNMVQADHGNKAPGLQNGGTMISYSPHGRYRCCQHNHAFGWPYYAEHLWMATSDDGLAAVLYAESEVAARVGDGDEVRIETRTAYPFDDVVEMEVDLGRAAAFPLYLRVPGWCEGMRVSVNGEEAAARPRPGAYVRVAREWRDGDIVRVEMPMEVEVETWEGNKGSASVRRGPLWYSLEIGERYVKNGGTEAWPEYEVFPTTAWNYGLVLDSGSPESSFRVEEREGKLARQPFAVRSAPVRLLAKGRRIPEWTVDRNGLVHPLQESPARSDEPEEEIELIPMGCARLRISAFPVIGEGPGAKEWAAPPTGTPHTASYEYDDIGALSDGEEPGSSDDHEIPRFTFWDRRGTTEWVAWTFERPRRVSGCEVYWFDDTGTGRCRVPASWRVLYLDGGEWREVEGASGYGVGRDAYNAVQFAPVEAEALRLEVRLREGFSGGILEWKVNDAE